MRLKNRTLALLSLGLMMVSLIIPHVYAAEVIVASAPLKDTYYQGEQIQLQITVYNNGSSVLEIKYVNVSIWRVERRYNRLRNVELIYNKTYPQDARIEVGNAYSVLIKIDVNFQPAQYNISVSVITDFVAGAGGETVNRVIPGHLFRVRAHFDVPVLFWAGLINIILLGVIVYIYRKLRS